jgi:hypothetical protein
VRLTNCSGTEYAITQTDGLGNYQLIVPAVLATGATLCVVEQNLSGYMNTGGSAGTTGGAYNLSTDTTQFTYTDGVTYTGVNFADVAQSALYTDGSATNPTRYYSYVCSSIFCRDRGFGLVCFKFDSKSKYLIVVRSLISR